MSVSTRARQQVQKQATNTLIDRAYNLAISKIDNQTEVCLAEKVRDRVSLSFSERGIFLIKAAVLAALPNR